MFKSYEKYSDFMGFFDSLIDYFHVILHTCEILYGYIVLFVLKDQKLSILRNVRELKFKNMHLYDTLVKVLKKPKMKPRETTSWVSK